MIRLVVDLSNKSAQIQDARTGAVLSMWSGVTRRAAEQLAYAAGWVRTGVWTLTSPPDGYWCAVRPCREEMPVSADDWPAEQYRQHRRKSRKSGIRIAAAAVLLAYALRRGYRRFMR